MAYFVVVMDTVKFLHCLSSSISKIMTSDNK